MSYNSEVKRDCIFYEEYRDMGDSWEDTQGCHCNGCPNYVSVDWMKRTARTIIKEREAK